MRVVLASLAAELRLASQMAERLGEATSAAIGGDVAPKTIEAAQGADLLVQHLTALAAVTEGLADGRPFGAVVAQVPLGALAARLRGDIEPAARGGECELF